MGFLLFLVAVLLAVVFMPVGFIYTTIRLWIKANFKTWWKRMGEYYLIIALSIDQMGNVIMKEFFNDVLIYKNGHKFGNEDETISSVLGKNQKTGTLRRLGRWLNWVLNKLDPNHSINAIEHNISEKIIAYEFHNYKTGHCYVDYMARPNMGETEGYKKIPLQKK